MQYFEIFTSEENDYEILQLKLDLSELASLLPPGTLSPRFPVANLTFLLDQIAHRAYEAGLRDQKSYKQDMQEPEQRNLKF